MMTRAISQTLTVLVIGLSLQTPQKREMDVVHLTPPAIPVPASYFGIHVHRPSAGTWPQVPIAEWRLWDSKGTVWYDLEPHKNQWNFSQLDKDVALAEQHGVGLLLTLGQTPPWATSRPHDPPAWRPGGAAPPRDERDWKNYVRTVAIRYQGRIHEYEIWNEPNVRESFTGTPEQLVSLSKDAYAIIHEIDPTAVVVSPGIEGDFGVSWLSKYLDLGGGNYADVIGYHFYTDHPPEYAAEIIQQVQKTLCEHGLAKPLWNTESGYQAHSDFEKVEPPVGSGKHVRSSEDFLAYVMREYILNWASGVTRLYWYDWDSNSMGLGDNLGKQKKPAAYGYAAIEKWLLGATLRSCQQDTNENWTCEIKRGKRNEWIVWNPDRKISRTLPSSWKVNRLDTLSPTGSTISSNLDNRRAVVYSAIPTLVH